MRKYTHELINKKLKFRSYIFVDIHIAMSQDNSTVDTIKSFPNPAIPNSDKGKKYIRTFIEAATNIWESAGSSSFYANRTRKLLAQSYRLGQQDPSMMKNLLNFKGEITEANVNFSPLPIVQRFTDVIVNNILNNNYKLKIELSDNMSVEKKDNFRDSLTEKMLRKDINEVISQASGVDISDENVPDDMEDIMLRVEVDYRDDDEISLLHLIKNINNTNKFIDIQREFVDDLCCFNEGVMKQRLDKKQGIVQEYVPNLNFIRSTSREMNNRRLQYAGEIRTISYSQLRSMISPSDGISDEAINEIAKFNVTKTGGNGNINWDDPIYADNIYGVNRWYDELTLDIVEMSFIDYNYDLYERKQTSLGLRTMHKRGKDYTLPQNSTYERELFTDTYETVYKGIWIKGTEYVIDAGRATNILLEGKDMSKARLPYTVYTIPGKSMVERMIPFADQMWITHLKHQQLMAKMRPAGIAVNISALEDALAGQTGQSFEPLDLMDYYNIEGDIMYRDDPDDDGVPKRGIPITPLNNAMGSQLSELTAVYNHNLDIIRDMTNVSKFMDGSQVSSKTLVGVQQQGIQQSNMGIDHLKYANEFMVIDSTLVTIMMIQDVFKYANIKSGYEKAIGSYSMGIIERLKNIPIEQLNITVSYGLTSAEEAALDGWINASIQAGEIGIPDAIMIKEIDDLRLAKKMLIKRREVYLKEKQEEIQQAHQNSLEQEQAKAKAKAEQIQIEAKAKSEAESALHAAKAKVDEKMEALKHKYKIDEIAKEYEGKKEVARIEVGAQAQRDSQAEKAKDNRINQTKTLESKIVDQKENNTGPKDFNTSAFSDKMKQEGMQPTQ